MPTTDSAAPSASTPSGSSISREPIEDVGLGVLVEIDQHVAAEDDVEHAEMGEVLQQVELTMLHHAADLGIELPELAVLREIFHQQLDRQAALHLELAEDAGLGFFQHGLRQVGRDDLGAPARQHGAGFLQAHRDRIRLLPGGGSRAPDPQGAAGRARLHQRRDAPLPSDDRTESCRGRRTSRWWSSPRPLPPSAPRRRPSSSERVRECPAGSTLRASGTRRLSTRYCLSADRSSPERSFRSLRRYS